MIAEGETETETEKDSPLLALKMQDGAMSQGIQLSYRSLKKGKEMDFSLELPEGI